MARALGRAHSDYARHVHIRRRESGHLWQNRFFSCPLEDACLWPVLAYIERNPIRAGLVNRPEEWLWSSATAHLSGVVPEVCINLDLQAWRGSWSPDLWRIALEQGIAEADFQGRLRDATQTGKPLGGDRFVLACERTTGRTLRNRKPGRKPLARMASQTEQATLYDVA